jgi:FkbM family methyltransferase
LAKLLINLEGLTFAFVNAFALPASPNSIESFVIYVIFVKLNLSCLKRYLNSFINIENWNSFWKYYYSIKGNNQDASPFFAELKGGLKAKIPAAIISAFDEIFLREIYKMKLVNSPSNPLILDIGANVGFFSIYMMSKYPSSKIIAFEPVPTNFELLEHHKSINNFDQMLLDKRAVMGDKKNISIGYNNSLNYSVGASFLNRGGTTTTIDVPAVSIPDIFNEYELDHCDLLKIDCEGAEYNILFNCPDKYFAEIRNIVVEVHNWVPEEEGTIEQLISFLKSHGYKILNKKNEILWCWK